MSLSPHELYREFSILCYDLTLRAQQPISLPPFLGSTLHGGFGRALQQIGCFAPNARACPPCQHPQQCPYNLLFEYKNLPLDHIPKRYLESPPKLYVFELPASHPSRLQTGERLQFRLTLFGPAIEMRIYPIVAMRIWSENGLGYERGRFEIERIVAANPLTNEQQQVYSSTDQMVQQNDEPLRVEQISRWCENWQPGNLLKLSFVTPARLFGRGYGPNDLDLKVVLKSALERLSILALLSGLPQGESDWQTPLAAAEKISVLARHVEMQDLSRYSKRQEQRMSYGGFLGHLLLQGDFSQLKPYLKIAELLHVGKNPTFGLGQVKFESV
ncbi:CRISPR system precrRNA processing endoribonuclease RAMP protein Cas6 [candidate division KSB1 bacterium]|nr:CRISPR system precrRNA processing endoribonuclease RAMP protein Cas6 [candidate division KSB1 bacterium]